MTAPLRLVAVGVAIAALIAFHFAMRADAARLCSNDATAYQECSR